MIFQHQDEMNQSNKELGVIKRYFLKGTMISAFDQAWLSVINFAIGLAFIKGAVKEEYGKYTMLYSVVLLIQNIHNAVATSPMTTVIPNAHREQRFEMLQDIFTFQTIANLGITVLASLLLVAASLICSVPLTYLDLVSVFISAFALSFREYVRGVLYVQSDPASVLLQDIVIGSLTLTTVAFLFHKTQMSSAAILLYGGLISITITSWNARANWSNVWTQKKRRLKIIWMQFWPCSKWALPSVAVSWAYTNAYLFIAGLFAGASVVADLSASRLLMSPLGMLFVAWMNVARPRYGTFFSEGKLQSMDRNNISVIGKMAATISVYVACLWISYPHLTHFILSEKYRGLRDLLLIWGLYFAINGLRNVGMVCMLSCPDGYRPLFHYGWVALLVTGIGSVALSLLKIGSWSSLLALICAEAVLAILIWKKGWPEMKQSYSEEGPSKVEADGVMCK